MQDYILHQQEHFRLPLAFILQNITRNYECPQLFFFHVIDTHIINVLIDIQILLLLILFLITSILLLVIRNNIIQVIEIITNKLGI